MAPQPTHFRHVPLRTSMNWPQSGHGSPSKPFMRAWEMASVRLSLPATWTLFEELLTRYPTKQAALLPTLWMCQEEFGWISTEVIHRLRDGAVKGHISEVQITK